MGERAAMPEQYLVILFVKLAVSASLASILARVAAVQRMLLQEERTLRQRLMLALAFSALSANHKILFLLKKPLHGQ